VGPPAQTAQVSARTPALTPEQEEAARQSEADNEFVLAQRFASMPSQALAESLGFSSIQEAKSALAKVREAELSEAANAEANKYVAANPPQADGTGFFACAENGTRVQAELRLQGLRYTAANIGKVVETLRAQGLLKLKPAPAEPTEAELYAMDKEKLFELAGGVHTDVNVGSDGWD
jgi:hypothetical protein